MRPGGCAGKPELTLPAGSGAGGRAGGRAGGGRVATGARSRIRVAAGRPHQRRSEGSAGCARAQGGAGRASGRGRRAAVTGGEEARRVRGAGPGGLTPGASPRWGSVQATEEGAVAQCRKGGCAACRALEPRPAGPEAAPILPNPAGRCPRAPRPAPQATVTGGARLGMEEGELGCRSWEAAMLTPGACGGAPQRPTPFLALREYNTSQFEKPRGPFMARACMFVLLALGILHLCSLFCKWAFRLIYTSSGFF